jgi:hypothetical protein
MPFAMAPFDSACPELVEGLTANGGVPGFAIVVPSDAAASARLWAGARSR